MDLTTLPGNCNLLMFCFPGMLVYSCLLTVFQILLRRWFQKSWSDTTFLTWHRWSPSTRPSSLVVSIVTVNHVRQWQCVSHNDLSSLRGTTSHNTHTPDPSMLKWWIWSEDCHFTFWKTWTDRNSQMKDLTWDLMWISLCHLS